LISSLAVIEEFVQRTIGIRPYMVQVLGALGLHKGYLTEMATGEGKSLTATLPAILAAWTGRPCHIVTVNDYLANRDAVEMKPLYHACGVSVGSVTSTMDPAERRNNYDKDVVYTTSKELLADFLRDRIILGSYDNAARRSLLALRPNRPSNLRNLVMRGIHTAIVDEADSVLIDEAVTPLIISRAQENQPLVQACTAAYTIAAHLSAEQDYTIKLKYKEIELTEAGRDRVLTLAESLPSFWQGFARRTELIEQALTAREFYKNGKQYVVRDGKVIIVDEFTGRLMENRTWSQGLHQSVEAKEGVKLSDPSETLARLSFQRFFRFFKKLSGMTGTGFEARGEFWDIYGLPVLQVPTNKPCVRQMYEEQVFATAEQKWSAIVDEVVRIQASGRPVLVGTRSVKTSENLSALLVQKGIEHELLNAVHHAEEARIVASAGEHAKVTIATNMAGRGTDIKLERGVADSGGLHVIASERHESGRIDRQLFGRCARQGDPGSARAFICLEDELISRFVPVFITEKLATAVTAENQGAKRFAQFILMMAQRAAQRLAFNQRRSVLKMDTWLEDALSFTGANEFK
jgi:preprotein translocase subunit SecA